MAELPPLREVIARHDLQAKKAFGQNFLFDLNLTRRIAREAGAREGGVFYEVGPGPGGLTRALLEEGAGRVIAVERDARFRPALEEIAAAYPGRLEIVDADALDIDEAALLPPETRIAANLPYNVGTALLIKWLTGVRAPEVGTGSGQHARSDEKWPPFWASLTLMFQKEVAQRIVARPGTEHYGRLSVLAAWRTRARLMFDVPARAFVPPPKVTSSVVRLEPRAEPLAPCALKDLERVTAAAFGQRRKMLRQSLKSLSPDAEARIAAAGIDPQARPETLAVEAFAALAREFSSK